MANFHTTVRFFDGLMYILVVSFGAVFLLKKKITPADFTAYLLMVGMLLGSVRQILQFSEQFQRGMSGIERFTEIIDTPPEEDGTGKKELTDVKGGISFRDVSFS